MTLAEMRTLLTRMTHSRSELTNTDYDLALNHAYRVICRGRFPDLDRTIKPLRFQELESVKEITLVTDDQDYAYPSIGAGDDFDAAVVDLLFFQHDATNDLWTELKLKSWKQFVKADSATGQNPSLWSTRNRQIYITPKPGASQSGMKLNAYYYGTPVALSLTSDEPVVPDAYHYCIVLLAARNLLLELGEPDAAASFEQALTKNLIELQTDSILLQTGPRALRILNG